MSITVSEPCSTQDPQSINAGANPRRSGYSITIQSNNRSYYMAVAISTLRVAPIRRLSASKHSKTKQNDLVALPPYLDYSPCMGVLKTRRCLWFPSFVDCTSSLCIGSAGNGELPPPNKTLERVCFSQLDPDSTALSGSLWRCLAT